MTALHPAFKLTVYAPRSVDATESTVLVPSSGAPHSDPFVVTSVQGVAGAKPYLDLPTGRGATIDALNKTATIDTLTVKLLDMRTTPGGSNASRWVSAFLGDGSGGNMLLGRLTKVEISLDGGATWTPYFTGRISAPALNGKLWVQLTLKGLGDDLDVDLFVGQPHPATAAYAALQPIAPLGRLFPVRSAPTALSTGTGYAGLPLTEPLRGTTEAPVNNTFVVDVDHTYGDRYRTIATKTFVDAAARVMAGAYTNSAVSAALTVAAPPLVMVRYVSGDARAGNGLWYEYYLDWAGLGVSGGTAFLGIFGDSGGTEFWKTSIEGIRLRQTPSGPAVPSTGATIDYYIIDPATGPTKTTPILIDDVNPVTYATDLCAGHFGRLDATGAPVRSVPFSAGGIDGSTVPTYRNRITQASKLNTELEQLCIQYQWGYYFDDTGTLTLVDLRRTALTAPVGTLTDDDLDGATGNLAWSQDKTSAVTTFFATYYPEAAMSVGGLPKPFDKVGSIDDLPDVPCDFIQELAGVSLLEAEIGPRSADMKPATFKLDATGFRFLLDAITQSQDGVHGTAIKKWLMAYADELRGPFGLGASYIDLSYRRAGSGGSVKPGQFWALQHSALPDPLTNQRGNPRLGLCVSRSEDGPRVKIRFLDAGENSVAAPPTLGTPTFASGELSLPVTLNASSEPVRVRYAVTATTVSTRPLDTDPAWQAGPYLTASGTAVIGNLPGGQRIWLGALSMPGAGAGFKLPSAIVAPTPDHLDLSAVPAPSGLAVTGTALDEYTASWTSAAPTLAVDLFLAVGASVSAIDADRIAPPLPPGTIQYPLPALAAATQYTVGVRQRDANGGTSSLTTLSFTTTSAVTTLNPPFTPTGFSGSQDAIYGMPRQDGVYGLAVVAAELPGLVEFTEQVETSPGSGTYGSVNTAGKVSAVQGDWTLFEKVAPNDGLRRLLAARSVRDGATASTYTAGVVVSPWTSLPLGPLPTAVQVEVTQLAPSPSGDAGVNLRFQVDAVDPLGRTCQVEIVSLQGTSVAVVSGYPAVGSWQPNDTIFKVSQPPSGAGPGTAIVRGQSAEGRYTTVSLTIPEQSPAATVAQPSAVISFDPIAGNTAMQAHASFQVSTPNAGSIKYIMQTGSQPTAASVVSGGSGVTGPIDGNSFAQTNVLTVALGTKVCLTVVPYTGASFTGTQLPPVEIADTFTTWGKQKTAYYQRTAWIDGAVSIGHTNNSNDDIVNAAMSSLVIRDPFRINTVIPVGATLVSASLNCWWSTATNPLGQFLFAVDANGTNINSGNATYGSGSTSSPQTVTVGLGSTTVSSGYVVLRDVWAPPVSASADAAQAGLQDVSITYIAPTQDVTP